MGIGLTGKGWVQSSAVAEKYLWMVTIKTRRGEGPGFALLSETGGDSLAGMHRLYHATARGELRVCVCLTCTRHPKDVSQ